MKCNYNLTKLSEKYQTKVRQDFEEMLNSSCEAKFTVSKDLEFASSDCYVENICGKQLWIKSRVYCCDKGKLEEESEKE